ncbi:deoxyguanosinetriphosphate triphosphohydrolase [Ehrlichia ruminantium]|uniref:Deoxyguanosinetriphosphate triphosphohydrolase-like protein n=2 Tax=Ehrlichia ruminantium TaxID=779 RepID=A0A0H3LZ71_EHRRW|nr:deoxyguanosinetriphosphate triphosphohydrolase [Ehrlichia ruminantium]CAH58096.1 putative metal dependent phosphohydrolase [Ehrlichia ruminantium str. Welgevonden]QLK51377.1 deoxyguanosinetriphosphate triphosphohydrolase [Ehrlichia ruminantium]QLK53212.1 deoxyguanosinetriphosphate triphosphohydrolase [Ehrlichia ruminantium]QLK57795.1 deoxyguanosinetriphosphate triphosphohydrolase [Ehrlichia ruminantium]
MSNYKLMLDLVKYACDPLETRGRVFPESEDPYRSCYQRDRDRIIYSGAFRKLQYKTQVFINYENDYYRTRLTHSLEVAQIARSLSRRLCVNEDLTEAISLAHDLGHPPFGHAGEEALNEMTQHYLGFDHNVQALRILTFLEKRYLKFDGINLTWESLEGIAKHNGPITGKHCVNPIKRVHKFILDYDRDYKLDLDNFSSAEAQIAAISDDIAYNMHDIDDGIRAKILVVDELLELPLIGRILKKIIDENTNYDISDNKVIHEFLRKTVDTMIEDVVYQVKSNVREYNIYSQSDIRNLGKVFVTFSAEMMQYHASIKNFLRSKLYNYYKVKRVKNKVKRIIKELFKAFYEDPQILPPDWSIKAMNTDLLGKSIVVCDFISGMTDRFAIQEHRRIFDTKYEMQLF